MTIIFKLLVIGTKMITVVDMSVRYCMVKIKSKLSKSNMGKCIKYLKNF